MKEKLKNFLIQMEIIFVDYSGLIFDKDLNIIKPFFYWR